MIISFDLDEFGEYASNAAISVVNILNTLRDQHSELSQFEYYDWLEETINCKLIIEKVNNMQTYIVAIKISESDYTMLLLRYAEYAA